MIRVPFKLDVNDGFVTLAGAVSLDGGRLFVEADRRLLDLVPLGTRRIEIPADEIEEIRVEAKLVRTRLIIRPFAFGFIEGYPGVVGDELQLPLARRDRDAARALAQQARLRNLPR